MHYGSQIPLKTVMDLLKPPQYLMALMLLKKNKQLVLVASKVATLTQKKQTATYMH